MEKEEAKKMQSCGPEVHESNSADIGGVSVFNQGIDLISIKLVFKLNGERLRYTKF